jgi:hypothetical protein
MRSFTISTDRVGPRRWWWVRIHDNVDQLREAAHRHRPWYGRDHWDDTCGCCHPLGWLNGGKGDQHWPANGYAGVIRYSEDYLTSEIVAHELVHAALWTYRMNVTGDVRLGRQCGGREEQLAYIYGELYADLELRLT